MASSANARSGATAGDVPLALLDGLERKRRASVAHSFNPSKLVCTDSPNFVCSVLPCHWRCNKYLPAPFTLASLTQLPRGTKVILSAGNDDNDAAELKNPTSEFVENLAVFEDLRFVGRSGRGVRACVRACVLLRTSQLDTRGDSALRHIATMHACPQSWCGEFRGQIRGSVDMGCLQLVGWHHMTQSSGANVARCCVHVLRASDSIYPMASQVLHVS